MIVTADGLVLVTFIIRLVGSVVQSVVLSRKIGRGPHSIWPLGFALIIRDVEAGGSNPLTPTIRFSSSFPLVFPVDVSVRAAASCKYVYWSARSMPCPHRSAHPASTPPSRCSSSACWPSISSCSRRKDRTPSARVKRPPGRWYG